MTATVQLDLVADDLDGHRVDIVLPPNSHRVWRGIVKLGDYFVNAQLIRNGKIEWLPIEQSDIDEGCQAEEVLLLVRPGYCGPDKACQRCQCNRALTGWRVCQGCRMILRRQGQGV
jgi:hypothetical protein